MDETGIGLRMRGDVKLTCTGFFGTARDGSVEIAQHSKKRVFRVGFVTALSQEQIWVIALCNRRAN